MRLPLRLLVVAVSALVAAGCGGGGPSGAASPSPSGDGTAAGPWLRATVSQAIAPVDAFARGPVAVITADGRWVTEGPIPAIYPGPLLPNLIQRPVSAEGRQRVVDAATALGLLAGKTDFTAGGLAPGGMTGRIELDLPEGLVTLTGDPAAQIQCITTPCNPPPGTPAAFAELFARLQDPRSLAGSELGPEEALVPDGYALLVGPAPAPQPGLGGPPVDWPLDVPLASFGRPVANRYRCGLVTGADAARLAPALQAANQLTQWAQDPTTSATFGIVARPVIDGEDACLESFGPG
jgi:hypothetical protein